MIKKIISGGQTGADQGALDAAIKLDIPHGGWLPKGRLTENGPLPDKYQLKEMATDSHPARTEKNVLDSDGTLILSHGKLTGGSELTQQLAEKHTKPCLHIDLNTVVSKFDAALKASNWIKDHDIEILNVAGARASKDPKIYQETMDILENVYYLGLIEGSPNTSLEPAEKITIPRTIDEAVEHLIAGLPLKDKAVIANMPHKELPSLHYSLGQYIVNKFGLWDENSELMKVCKKTAGSLILDPDGASSMIIKALWEELRKSYKLRIVK